MEKDRIFSEDNAFLAEISEEELSLIPLLEVREEKNEQPKTKRLALAGIVAFLCMALIFSLVILLCANQRGEYIEVESATASTEGDWRGAFLEREFYERATACSVSIRAGNGASATRWSGVVLGKDGQIATAADMIDDGQKGRIYVALNDGREYEVDSIRKLNETGLALLKIRAKDLVAAEICLSELHTGQEVVAVGGDGDILACSVSSLRDGRLRVSVPTGNGLAGAPIFDEEGELAAILCSDNENGRILDAIEMKELKKGIFE